MRKVVLTVVAARAMRQGDSDAIDRAVEEGS